MLTFAQLRKIIEGHQLGTLFHEDGEEAVGYWFQPRTSAYHVISWNNADNVNHFSDHCDVVYIHPEWFGKTEEDMAEYDDCDGVRYDVTLSGWVRIGFNNFDKQLRLDARNPRDAQKALRWFVQHHGMPKSTTIDIVTATGLTPYFLKDDDLSDFEQTGRLQPHNKGDSYSW